MIRTALLFLCFLMMVPSVAHAHEIRPGYFEISARTAPTDTDKGVVYDVMWKAPLRLGAPLAVTPEPPDLCQQSTLPTLNNTGSAIIARYVLSCTRSIRGSRIGFVGLDATLTDVIVKFTPQTGRAQTLRATASQPFVEIAITPSRWAVAKTYFILGVEHIWFGFDHLLFVLGLVLLITGTRRIIETITAFTVAHSLTLIATTLGWVGLPIAPVEAVIALSIVFLATEIMSKKPNQTRFVERYPWLVAASFGLLHGFGFASALTNIGMPESDVATALLTFNLGVEFGQLSFVAVLLVALYVINRVKLRRYSEVLASYFMGSLSMFWLFERLI